MHSTSFSLWEKISDFGLKKKSLWAISSMLLFFMLFDGVIGYTVPLLLTENGLTKTQMGLVFSFSSIAGALFDFVLSKIILKVNFRRLFLAMFAVCLVYAMVLFKAHTIWLYLLAMALWGIYYDLMDFAVFDFVGRFTQRSEHAQSFGIMDMFRSIGNLLAPIIAGVLIIATVDYKPFAFALICLCVAWFFYVALLKNTTKPLYEPAKNLKAKSIVSEFLTWKRVGKKILPVVVFAIFLSCYDAFFWTLGPLISEELSSITPFGGLFLTAYFLPTMLIGLFVGRITNRYGKKKTSFLAILGGSIILISVGFITSAILLITVVFASSVLAAVAWPAIRGVFADYVSESTNVESEINAMGDLSANLGYVIGPVLAGFLADQFGDLKVFSILGVFGIVLSLILLKFTPRHINIPQRL